MRRNAGLITIPFILVLIFLWLMYQPGIQDLNNHLYSASGDGISGYFTNAWHAKHDTDLVHHSGMNYPFGDLIFNTSVPPLITNLIKVTNTYEYSVGVLNTIMLLSQALTAVFLFLILRLLKSPVFPAIAGAIAITLLNPQVARMGGHYGLSFSFFIPAVIYFTQRFLLKPRLVLWPVLNFLILALACFIHPYLAMISAMAGLIISLSNILIKKPLRSAGTIIRTGLQFILPLLIFMFFIKLIDTHTGRTTEPWGMFYFISHPWLILFPPWLHSYVSNTFQIEIIWEGIAYIGSLTLLVFLIVLALFTARKVKTTTTPSFIFSLLIASFILLAFSFGIPFRFRMEFLVDLFPILKQFRALGRFSWVFYFAVGITTWYFLSLFYKYILTRGQKVLAISMVLISSGFTIYESVDLHRMLASSFSGNTNQFLEKNLENELKAELVRINPEDYQAIIPLPWFHVGSENFQRYGSDQSIKKGFYSAYHTGIPLTASMLARTSISESKKQVSFFTPGFLRHEILNFPSEKPFLVMWTGEQLTEPEQLILSKSTPVEGSKLFYELNLDQMHQPDTSWYLTKYRERLPFLQKSGPFLVDGDAEIISFNGYEKTKSDITFEGKGAVTGVADGLILWKGSSELFTVGKDYELSLWYWNAAESQNQVMIQIQNIVDDMPAIGHILDPKISEIISGDWSLGKVKFQVHPKATEVRIVAFHNHHKKKTVYIDNLLIAPAGATVYREFSDSMIFINNMPVPRL